jgi:hypothetical protein
LIHSYSTRRCCNQYNANFSETFFFKSLCIILFLSFIKRLAQTTDWASCQVGPYPSECTWTGSWQSLLFGIWRLVLMVKQLQKKSNDAFNKTTYFSTNRLYMGSSTFLTSLMIA